MNVNGLIITLIYQELTFQDLTFFNLTQQSHEEMTDDKKKIFCHHRRQSPQ